MANSPCSGIKRYTAVQACMCPHTAAGGKSFGEGEEGEISHLSKLARAQHVWTAVSAVDELQMAQLDVPRITHRIFPCKTVKFT